MRRFFTRAVQSVMGVALIAAFVWGGVATSTSAQEAGSTLGLSAQDFALWTAANTATLQAAEYAYDFNFSLQMEANGFPFDIDAQGSGVVRTGSAPEFQLRVESETDNSSELIPITFELRVIGDQFYVNVVDPESGEETGWLGDSVSNVERALNEGFEAGFADASAANMTALADTFGNLPQMLTSLDTSAFVNVERENDETISGVDAAQFIISVDFEAFFGTDFALELIAAISQASSGTALTDQMRASMSGIISQLFADSYVIVNQYVGIADERILRTTFTVELNIDPSALLLDDQPISVLIDMFIDLSDYDGAAAVEVPDDVQMEFVEKLQDGTLRLDGSTQQSTPPGAGTPGDDAIVTTTPTDEITPTVVQPTRTAIPATPTTPPTNTVAPTRTAARTSEPTVTESESADGLTLTANEPLTVTYEGDPIDLIYEATDSQTIMLSARSLESLGDLDTTLEILDETGDRLAYNDDHGTDRTDLAFFDSLLTDVELSGGVYTIRIDTFSGRGEGEIEVLLETESSSAPEPTATPDKDEEGEEGNDADITIEGELQAGEDFEYEFEGVEGDVISIAVRAVDSGFDPVVSLIAPDGEKAAENDDYEGDQSDLDLGNLDPLIDSYTLEQTGTYTILVRGFASSEGAFELLILTSGGVEPTPDDPSQAEVIEETLRSDETYQYALEVEAGDMFTFTAQAADAEMDPVLVIYDPDGTYVTSSDDHGTSAPDLGIFDARISRFIFSAAGEYLIEVSDYAYDGGEFIFTVQPELTNAPLGEGEDTVFVEEIDANDVYTQTFNAQAGEIITITVRTLTDGFDVNVVLLSPDGVIVADSDDHGTGDNFLAYTDARIPNFIIVEGGVHTIEVSGFGQDAGSFALVINGK